MPYCDYKQIAPGCQYSVPSSYSLDGFRECGEPAIYKVWWDMEGNDCLFVCQEHLSKILDDENAEIEDKK